MLTIFILLAYCNSYLYKLLSFDVSPSTVARAWRKFQEPVTLGELDRAVEGP